MNTSLENVGQFLYNLREGISNYELKWGHKGEYWQIH